MCSGTPCRRTTRRPRRFAPLGTRPAQSTAHGIAIFACTWSGLRGTRGRAPRRDGDAAAQLAGSQLTGAGARRPRAPSPLVATPAQRQRDQRQLLRRGGQRCLPVAGGHWHQSSEAQPAKASTALQGRDLAQHAVDRKSVGHSSPNDRVSRDLPATYTDTHAYYHIELVQVRCVDLAVDA